MAFFHCSPSSLLDYTLKNCQKSTTHRQQPYQPLPICVRPSPSKPTHPLNLKLNKLSRLSLSKSNARRRLHQESTSSRQNSNREEKHSNISKQSNQYGFALTSRPLFRQHISPPTFTKKVSITYTSPQPKIFARPQMVAPHSPPKIMGKESIYTQPSTIQTKSSMVPIPAGYFQGTGGEGGGHFSKISRQSALKIVSQPLFEGILKKTSAAEQNPAIQKKESLESFHPHEIDSEGESQEQNSDFSIVIERHQVGESEPSATRKRI